MSSLELYQEINQTLDIIAWPGTVCVLLFILRRSIRGLAERFTEVEGKFGDASLRATVAADVTRKTLDIARNHDREGKAKEVNNVVDSAGRFLERFFRLSHKDLEYLVRLHRGEPPKRRWGDTRLVRDGFVEFDGGNLTDRGRDFVKRYLAASQTNSVPTITD